MIIEQILSVLYNIFTSALDFVSINQIPSETFNEIITQYRGIISTAGTLINLVVPYSFCVILMYIVIGTETATYIYFFVIWILKKIPVAAIE